MNDFSGVKRVRYFTGQLLSVDDLRDEQDYFRQKRFLHNRALHGSGVVSGLRISLSSDASPQVIVEPGLALDPRGREVILATEVRLAICEEDSPQYVVIEYAERETDPVPAAQGASKPEASRIEEGAVVRLSMNGEAGDGVLIGRMVAGSAGWALDLTFEPQRPR